jgi:hypothetical protein
MQRQLHVLHQRILTIAQICFIQFWDVEFFSCMQKKRRREEQQREVERKQREERERQELEKKERERQERERVERERKARIAEIPLLWAALTPRAVTWLETLKQPKDQNDIIVCALVRNAYTSVETIAQENPEKIMQLMEKITPALKPGAKIALRKKLQELKVIVTVQIHITSCGLIHGSHFFFSSVVKTKLVNK